MRSTCAAISATSGAVLDRPRRAACAGTCERRRRRGRDDPRDEQHDAARGARSAQPGACRPRSLRNRTTSWTIRTRRLVLRFAVPVVFPSELARSLRHARVVAVIPARYRSTRLARQAARADRRPDDGRARVTGAPRDARRVDAVVVATDDERVAAPSTRSADVAVMTRADHATGTDRLAEVAAHARVRDRRQRAGRRAADDPGRDRRRRRRCSRPTRGTRWARCASGSTIPADLHNPSVVKMVVDRSGLRALFHAGRPSPSSGPAQPAPAIWRHLGLYVYGATFLLELARAAADAARTRRRPRAAARARARISNRTVETTADTIGVDTPEDLERVRRLVQAGAPSHESASTWRRPSDSDP